MTDTDTDLTENERMALAELEQRIRDRRPLSHREIGRLLGISHGTVQNIEKRALAKMRKRAMKGCLP